MSLTPLVLPCRGRPRVGVRMRAGLPHRSAFRGPRGPSRPGAELAGPHPGVAGSVPRGHAPSVVRPRPRHHRSGAPRGTTRGRSRPHHLTDHRSGIQPDVRVLERTSSVRGKHRQGDHRSDRDVRRTGSGDPSRRSDTDATPFLLDWGIVKSISTEAYVFTGQDCGLAVAGNSHHEASWQWFLAGPVPNWGSASMSSQAFPPVEQPPCDPVEQPNGGGGGGGSSGGGSLTCWYWVTYDQHTGEVLDADSSTAKRWVADTPFHRPSTILRGAIDMKTFVHLPALVGLLALVTVAAPPAKASAQGEGSKPTFLALPSSFPDLDARAALLIEAGRDIIVLREEDAGAEALEVALRVLRRMHRDHPLREGTGQLVRSRASSTGSRWIPIGRRRWRPR